MNGNQFELTGRVNFIEVKYTDKGMAITRALIAKKGRGEGEYISFAVTFFKDTAEAFGENIKKGDSVNVIGRLDVDKYETKEGKKREDLKLIGNSFTKVVYDADKKEYVSTEEKEAKPWD